MRFWAIEGNTFRLDGGSLFGNAPKVLWQRWMTPDEQNRVLLASRCLLWETDEGKKILFEAGMGDFFEDKLRERYEVSPKGNDLLRNLEAVGVAPQDIDTVVLSHLHFDHCGGLLTPYSEEKEQELVFPNASFVVGKRHWERCLQPNPREKASFLPQLTKLLQNSSRLTLVDETSSIHPLIKFSEYDGHTVGMLLTEFKLESPVLFCADLVPGLAWTSISLSMGFDRSAELSCKEKKEVLEDLETRRGYLFYTHDPKHSLARVVRNEKGVITGEPVAFDQVF
jgi:glyoxylase-like metal-dependent hydrolase (beta-lactamase superfamily II)